MPLSAKQILAYVEKGRIQIDPFEPRCAKGASLDVRLGEFYFRMVIEGQNRPPCVRNLYASDSGKLLWGDPRRAEPAEKCLRGLGHFAGIRKDDLVFLLYPGEIILAHTHEFVGSDSTLVGEIRGRSTVKRNAITVCSDGNWGDPGFKGRWTMVIQNGSRNTIVLVVGRQIAQIVFNEVLDASDYQEGAGKYQNGSTFEEVKASWKPENHLPRMHRDWEATDVLDCDSI